MIKYSIDKVHPTRDLTPHEKVFLQGLAEYKLFLDKSLFFQIDDLQKHTELVLSSETGTAYRYDYPDPDELEKEIKELEKMIKELEDMLNNGQLTQEYWELLKKYREQLDELKKVRDEMEEDPDETRRSYTKTLLGKYEHKHGYDSKVILYVNNIEAYAKNPYDTMLLMGQVLLHEYFHSFYYHVGIESEERIKYVEEPMAEFGSLVVLDSVASSGSPISIYADHALTYGLDFVKKKQSCKGLTAAYGFGAYLFDKHKDDYSDLIARYAILSRMLDKSDKMVLEYKYLVYPCYPFGLEEIAYEKLVRLLRGGGKSKKVSSHSLVVPSVLIPSSIASIGTDVILEKILRKFAYEVFKYLETNDLLNQLTYYITTKVAEEKRAICSESFNLNGILYVKDCSIDDPRFDKKLWFNDTFDIGDTSYFLSNQWSENNENTHLHFDDLANMLKYVYDGRFEIGKKVDEKGAKEFVLFDKKR